MRQQRAASGNIEEANCVPLSWLFGKLCSEQPIDGGVLGSWPHRQWRSLCFLRLEGSVYDGRASDLRGGFHANGGDDLWGHWGGGRLLRAPGSSHDLNWHDHGGPGQRRCFQPPACRICDASDADRLRGVKLHAFNRQFPPACLRSQPRIRGPAKWRTESHAVSRWRRPS
jgi:hypothetical protein